MAMTRALGPARKLEAPALREAAPGKIPAWAETVLFGTAEDVRRLLDGGLDPNAATAAGTTALMMAAPDAGKIKLLLDRGAKVNARTGHGYSALLMAALYADSAPSLRLLLDRGAELRTEAPVLNRAYPLALAAIAGSADSVKLLGASGDSPNQNYVYAGLEPSPPLALIASMNETDVAEAILDAGGNANSADADGLTPLMWAVLANKLEMARLLIARGADVNHTDNYGMTPLLYATSIDFDDSAMLELLLKSGARKDARTKEGLTALDLARKYGHTHLLDALK